jgi:DnaK suppressor protein
MNMDKQITVSVETLAQIKAQLLADKARITAELAGISTTDSNETHAKFPELGDKIDESAQEIEGYTTNLATEKILEENLRDIEAALARIEAGTYGICKYCGQPIAEKRLEARPVASACVDCKQKLQNG